MEFHMKTDLTLLCRVCLKDTSAIEFTNIYEVSTSADRPNIYGMLGLICSTVFSSGDFTEQQARDSLGMPKIVCSHCKDKIVDAYNLYETCVETDRKLWEIIMVKQELEEEDPVNGQPLDITETTDFSLKPSQNSSLHTENLHLKTENIKGESSGRIIKIFKDEEQLASKPSLHGLTKEEYDICLMHENDLSRKVVVPQDPSIRTCDLCSKVLRSVAALKSHMQLTHPNQILRCGECDDVFFSTVKLEDHIMFHRTGRAFPCPVCKRRYKTQPGLRNHVRSHTSDRPHKCNQCEKSFYCKNSYTQHMKRHTGIKPHRCGLCPSRFLTKGALKSHMVTHTRERKHACDICGSRFTMLNSLTKHNRIHTGERPFPCEECGLRFISSHHLKRHLRTHTGEKPFKCSYCDMAYAQSNDLVKHTKFHVGDKPYKCDQCDEAFRLLAELRNHYRVHISNDDDCKEESAVPNSSEGLRFTSVSVLNRRFELEQQRDPKEKDSEEIIKLSA